MSLSSLLLFFCAHQVFAIPGIEIPVGRRLYNGYKILRATPQNQQQRGALLLLQEGVDFWSDVGPETSVVDIMVDPYHIERVQEYLSVNGIDFKVMINDLQKDIEAENDVDILSNISDQNLPEKKRDKRQNQNSGLFGLNLLPFLKPHARPRRKPQLSDQQSQRVPRVIQNPSKSLSSSNLISSTIPVPSPTAQTSSFPSSNKPGASPCAPTGMNWVQYQSFATISAWLDCMAANFGHKMSLIHIGKSTEGRDLKVVKIGDGDTNKAAVFIDGGIHAREWVSPASVTYLIHRMVETEGEYDSLLDRFNVYILPVVNPDGYEYSRNHDRMWRKTRSRTGKKNLFGNECHGVDPNRNFGYHWGGYGASDDACKETYRGKHAFSEPETLAMKNFLLSEKADFKLYLTFHSYGQYILYPWGYDKLDTRDFRDLKRVGDITGNALKKLNGVTYQIGSAAKMLYPASGGSDDWAKGGAGIKFSYTVELPDTGRHGFILPARHIKAVGFQATTVVKAMLTEIGSYLPK